MAVATSTNTETNTSQELQIFLKNHPMASSFDNFTDFEAFVKKMSPLSDARGLWNELSTNTIPPTKPTLEGEKQTDESPPQEGITDILAQAALAPLAFFSKPDSMENDGAYKKGANALKEKWLQANNPEGLKKWKKNKNDVTVFESREGLTFLYGTLPIEAEMQFRQDVKNTKKVAHYDKKRKKIYKNISDDPEALRIRKRVDSYSQALSRIADGEIDALDKKTQKKLTDADRKRLRNERLRKLGFEDDFDETIRKYQHGEWERFVKANPDKARVYLNKTLSKNELKNESVVAMHDSLKAAYESVRQQSEPVTISATQGQIVKALDEQSPTETQIPKIEQPVTTPKQPTTGTHLPTTPVHSPQQLSQDSPHPTTPLETKLLAKQKEAVSVSEKNKKTQAALVARRKAFIDFLYKAIASARRQPPSYSQSETEPQESASPKEQKRGLLSQTIDAVNQGRGLYDTYKALRAAGTAGEVAEATEGVQAASGLARLAPIAANPWFWIVLGIIILIIIVIAFFLSLTARNQQPAPGTTIGSATDISACTFYRGGDKIQGLQFGNPQLAALVSDVATKVDVPPAVLAGIMRVETGGALASTDTTYLTNDYDAVSSGVAYGIMQFTPATFVGVFNANKDAMGNLFGKVAAKTQIDPQSAMAPANILRIYSIRDSIIATAFKIKNDKQSINGDGPWDQPTVSRIASLYYSGGTCTMYPNCNTGPYDYGDDVWKSYSNCITAPIAGKPPVSGIASCPLPGKRTIGCGSFMSDPKFNRSACAGPNPEDRGHMGRSYVGAAYAGRDATLLKRRAHSIDVDAPAGETVYLPTINGQPVTWTYNTSYSIAPEDGGGSGHVFETNVGSDRWVLHLVHMNGVILPTNGKTYKSGDAVTSVAATSYTHLHINIGKNPTDPNGGTGWIDPESMGICVN